MCLHVYVTTLSHPWSHTPLRHVLLHKSTQSLPKHTQQHTTVCEFPDTAMHYEFVQDYRVHIKHTDGHFEYVPYFCLPAKVCL